MYYGVIKNIIEYSFDRNKNLKVVFIDCDWFDPYHGTRETILVWLKSNTHVDCVVVTHLSLLTRWSRSIICHTHVKS
jgi:Cft2 family RNA processing exonuclease